MNWKRIFEIARWEYLQKVRSKGFIASLLLTPLMIAFSVVPAMMAGKGPDSSVVVGVVDQTGQIAAPLASRLASTEKLSNGQPAYVVQNYQRPGQPADSAIAQADRDVLSGKIEGTIVIRDSAGHPIVVYRSTNAGNIRLTGVFEETIGDLVTERKLIEAGIDTAVYRKLVVPVSIRTVKVTEHGSNESVGFGETFFSAYGINFLLMILILTTGGSLVRSLVEEKSNRIMELLVSSGTPQELMWGKLIGLSALGVTQLLSWIVLGVVAAMYFSVSAGMLGMLSSMLTTLPLMLLYVILGYLFYAALFVGVGSLVTTEQEAQVLTSYLVIFLAMPLAFSFAIIQNPNATYVKVLSYVPLMTPSLMILRTVTKMPDTIEILGTILVMVASVIITVWASSRIFRTAILLYGKRPTVPELLRWLRS
jgi:ABC-2 type transport system permease protein